MSIAFCCLFPVATAVTGFPWNGTVYFQNVSCNGTESSPSNCSYLPATDPQCNNSTAGVRCTEGELATAVLFIGA